MSPHDTFRLLLLGAAIVAASVGCSEDTCELDSVGSASTVSGAAIEPPVDRASAILTVEETLQARGYVISHRHDETGTVDTEWVGGNRRSGLFGLGSQSTRSMIVVSIVPSGTRIVAQVITQQAHGHDDHWVCTDPTYADTTELTNVLNLIVSRLAEEQ